MNDITSAMGATQPVYLVQSQHRLLNGRAMLRVDIEGARMPTLHEVEIKAGATMTGGALKPDRRYVIHLGIGWSMKMKATDEGVRIELHDVRKKGSAMCPDQAWRWAMTRVHADLPWWPIVQACEWGAGEAGEVAA